MARQGSCLACPLAPRCCATSAASALLVKDSFNVPLSNLTSILGLWKPAQLASSAASHFTPPHLFHNHAGQDLLCTLAAFVSSFAWIRLFDFLVQRNVLEPSLSRRLVHISTGILYAMLWPVFSISPWSCYFALAIPFTNAGRLLVYGLGIIEDVRVVKSIRRSGSSRVGEVVHEAEAASPSRWSIHMLQGSKLRLSTRSSLAHPSTHARTV
ncbi:hypothetical protein L7F22_045569 [Adiantum nelumboides]|nr:hypothetical protein [Adiantum nelumboides]